MLSNTCKYAIRAVIYIAINQEENKKIGIKKITEDMELPFPFLAKILQTLVKKGILNSAKGPNGGFYLAKPADEISFFEVVNIIDGADMFQNCLFGLEICKNQASKKLICPIHPQSAPIRAELYKLFKNQTFGNIAENLKEVNEKFSL